MTKTRCAPALPLLSALVLALAGGMPSALAGTPEERMTRGKLAADLGDQRVAEELFAGVAADAAVPANARAEALVRLGVVQRALGKMQSSAAAFQKAMQSPARDADVTRLLTLAIAGVAPDRARWATRWREVRLATRTGTAAPQPSIQWPGPGPQGLRKAFPATDPVTLDLEDVSLPSLILSLFSEGTGWPPGSRRPHSPRRLPGFEAWPDSYVAPTALQALEFVIHDGVQGQVTVKVADKPWNELFESVLASNGLGFVLEKNLLFIARVEDLVTLEPVRGRTHASFPISLIFSHGNLVDVLSLFKDITDHPFVLDPNLQGWVDLRFSNRPWSQCLDLILATHDLAVSRIEPPDSKPGTTALRISRLADVKGGEVDLSTLPPPSPNP